MKPFFVFGLFITNFSCAAQMNFKERVLDGLFRTPEISKLLSLNDLKDRGPIRIYDPSRKFRGVIYTFIPKGDQEGIPLNAGVIRQLPIDWNTGYFRDIMIAAYKKKGGKAQIDLYISNYLCVGAKKSRQHIMADILFGKDDVKITIVSNAVWH